MQHRGQRKVVPELGDVFGSGRHDAWSMPRKLLFEEVGPGNRPFWGSKRPFRPQHRPFPGPTRVFGPLGAEIRQARANQSKHETDRASPESLESSMHLEFEYMALVRAEIADFLVLGGPKKTCHKVGGKAPHLLGWFVGPPGPPRPRKSRISGRPKNHVLKTQV